MPAHLSANVVLAEPAATIEPPSAPDIDDFKSLKQAGRLQLYFHWRIPQPFLTTSLQVAAVSDAASRQTSTVGPVIQDQDVHAQSKMKSEDFHSPEIPAVNSRNEVLDSLPQLSVAEIASDSISIEDAGGVVNRGGTFQFCAKCKGGIFVRITKSRFTAFRGINFYIQNTQTMEAEVIKWDMKDERFFKGEFHEKCDEARKIKHKKGTNTDEVIDLLKECLKAPELCNGKPKELHYVKSKDRDKCYNDYKAAKEKIDEKFKSPHPHHNFSYGQSMPSWALLVVCMLLLNVVISAA
eukprot:gnl/MRDRNA2_/MRDRNA2_163090_c0_seq1.p1 gnl/MRDRNA2_/MRDRNA2_163090_c0~~gnl/MRDRNA2_/MRDRNA2_163090_c0_seq1.p1  ORF type:complete len:303 (+),score=56.85 gnl/MRDRNA2_/MRDRNA2_163090_c0_seq1:27-911(+)